MARTESLTIQVHPDDEQSQINLMQKFHWNLLSTQEIKSVDSHLERRGDKIFSITSSERYVKLAFSRETNIPHLNEIKKLENEYFSLPTPKLPKLFPGGIIVWIILNVPGLVVWSIYLFAKYIPKKKEVELILADTHLKRSKILDELQQYDQ